MISFSGTFTIEDHKVGDRDGIRVQFYDVDREVLFAHIKPIPLRSGSVGREWAEEKALLELMKTIYKNVKEEPVE